MKYIKTFEYIVPLDKTRLEGDIIGKYVIIHSIVGGKELEKFLLTNIGQIVKNDIDDNTINVSYEGCEIPNELKGLFNNCRWFASKEIEEISDTKEKLEYILQANLVQYYSDISNTFQTYDFNVYEEFGKIKLNLKYKNRISKNILEKITIFFKGYSYEITHTPTCIIVECWFLPIDIFDQFEIERNTKKFNI